MRLTCPNCQAQYEVDDSAIPARGRDVQCSSCGHGWFARPEARPLGEAITAPAPAPPTDAEVVSEDAVPGAPATDTPPSPEGPLGPRLAPKRELDPAIAEVLRAEAAREATQRRREAAEALEQQQEFALDPAEPALPPEEDNPVAADKDAPPERPTFSKPKAPVETTRTQVPRRDLLPDIDEINSSLRAQGPVPVSEREAWTAAEVQAYRRRGRGFRLGFSVVLLTALAAVLVYGFAPGIAEAVPELAPALEVYVTQANVFRIWLDGQVTNGIGAAKGLLERFGL